MGEMIIRQPQDQELMFDEHRLGNDGTQTSRSC